MGRERIERNAGSGNRRQCIARACSVFTGADLKSNIYRA